MTAAEARSPTLEAVREVLEGIVDPCSEAIGAPAGLVSLGLVQDVEIDESPAQGAHLRVDLCVTEPGCLMAAIFKETAERELSTLPGVSAIDVRVDYRHVWDPDQMDPDYRLRLTRLRAERMESMRTLRQPSPAESTGARAARTTHLD